MVWLRSPLATAPITRATSVVGWTRSPIIALTESTHSLQHPVAAASRPRSLDPSLLADDLGDPLELPGKALVQIGDIVESFGDLAVDAGQIRRQAGREVAFPKGTQCLEKQLGIKLRSGGFDL